MQQLLEKGYTVHATVRSAVSGNPKIQHLLKLDAAFPGSLVLFEADLMVPGSFDKAVEGSTYVFHTASPVAFTVSALYALPMITEFARQPKLVHGSWFMLS